MEKSCLPIILFAHKDKFGFMNSIYGEIALVSVLARILFKTPDDLVWYPAALSVGGTWEYNP